jgi:hypothetical protein
MALPGECANEIQTVCMECGTTIDLQVLSSAAGYYIGFFCPECGPYSRESGYFHSLDEAETVFDLGDFAHI